jgi:uncharacterized membrane protein YhfC
MPTAPVGFGINVMTTTFGDSDQSSAKKFDDFLENLYYNIFSALMAAILDKTLRFFGGKFFRKNHHF